MSSLTAIARLTLASVFLLGVAGKWTDLPSFIDAVGKLTGITQRAKTLAGAVISAEVAVVVALIFAPHLGFLFAGSSLSMFTLAIVSSLRRGRVTPCNCFGPSTKGLSWTDVLRNALLLLACAIGYLATRQPVQLPRSQTLIGTLGVSAALSLIVAHSDSLLTLVKETRA